MMYGRRYYKSESVTKTPSKEQMLVFKAFQLKYARSMLLAIAGGSLLFFTPVYYFLNQNYALFTDLAFDVSPQLVAHLEREVHWLLIFMLTSLISIAAVTFYLSMQMTKNIMIPLTAINKHMQQLVLGIWNAPEIDLDSQKEFKDLSMTYDYFHRTLKAATDSELKLLEKINVDPQNREAYRAWKQLISEKRARLGYEALQDATIESVEVSNVSDLKRHAS